MIIRGDPIPSLLLHFWPIYRRDAGRSAAFLGCVGNCYYDK